MPHEESTGRDLGELAWESDNVRLTTVGVDIGSTTSHLMFSRLHLQRSSDGLTSRFEVVDRQVLFRSAVLLTPYLSDDTIDVQALATFIDTAYVDAQLARSEVDTGAVILTGAALQRRNSRLIAELFAAEGGRFVCASAGHLLEASLAAYGSGAVARSARDDALVLNIDIGGGTTKLALIDRGEILGKLAISVGARIVATDDDARVVRLEPSAMPVAESAGVCLESGAVLPADAKSNLGDTIAEVIVSAAAGRLSERGLDEYILDGWLPPKAPSAVTFSGGVAEVYYGRAEARFGDLAGEIAAGLRSRSADLPGPVMAPAEGIRATVVGASQFSVQVSGNTVLVSDRTVLPVRNVPVVPVQDSLVDAGDPLAIRDAIVSAVAQRHREPGSPVVVAVRWSGDPHYATLLSLAKGIAAANQSIDPGALILACEADIAATVGSIMSDELQVPGALVALDGLSLSEFDFIDIGEVSMPANVVPVVIKSLVFPA